MGRWDIKERFIPQINSYRIFSPKDPLVIHDLFDLVTKIVLYAQEEDSFEQGTFLHMRYSVGHGMAVLGLDHLEMSKIWIDPQAEHRTVLGVLSLSEDRDTERLLKMLWRYRHRLALLPETWRSLLEGHPVLGPLRSRCEYDEIVPIADGIIGTARRSVETIKEIDNLILKVWGITEPLPQKTMKDLANCYPEVLELNGWYSYEDFGLSPKS